MNAKVLSSASFAVIAWLALAIAPPGNVKLNPESFRFAQELIEQGHFVSDKNGAWREHQPSAKEENDFIHMHGLLEYAQWHLGIDPRRSEKSKACYKFPFGDFKNVHRSGLLAIRSRARQYGYSDIEKAAAELQQELEQKAKAAHWSNLIRRLTDENSGSGRR